MRQAHRTPGTLSGSRIFGVMVFPVFWMVSTAFKPDDKVYAQSPQWLPLHPTIRHFADAIERPFFWQNVKNSLIVVTARSRSRSCSRSSRRWRSRSTASTAAGSSSSR